MQDSAAFPDQFKKKFPLTGEKWNEYKRCFSRVAVPARTILLREGDIARKLFLIEKGCIRVWFSHQGKDITFQFFIENNTVASMESFRKACPSVVAIETIEPCVLWSVHKKDLGRMIDEIGEIPVVRRSFIDAIFERTFDYMKHFLSFIKDSPLERYQNLLKDKPKLVQRVPQHYIASYLGISSVHLSRIKNKLARKKPSPRI